MELQQVKTYLEKTHQNYIDMVNQNIQYFNSEPNDNKVMKDFFLQKATEYTNKADAILKIIEFINS
tara:strand:+ start:305 stop:502 length:198 start_codon:yes stop_codon:yes gene_type:complete